MKKTISILLLLCLLLGLAACGGAKKRDEPAKIEATYSNAKPTPTPTPTAQTPAPVEAPTALPGLAAAKDYAEVYARMTAVSGYGYWRNDGLIFAEAEAADEAVKGSAAPMATEAPTAGNAAGDYSETNVQVKGVDEGDIVKTDGKYIYVLSGDTLRILRAAGADTRELFSKEVGEDYYRDYTEKDGEYKGSESRWRSAQELYISGSRLTVIYNVSAWSESYREDGGWSYTDSSRTEIELYDVSDPAAPRLLTTVGQDGSFVTSRLTDGVLYLISRYWVYDPDEDDPDSFIPRLYDEGEAKTVDCACIWIPERSGNQWSVVSAFGLEDGAQRANLSLLGGADTVYMNGSDLYLARSAYVDETSEPYTEAVYTVTEHSWRQQTTITRVSLAGGGLTVQANGSVDGSLLSQFSMDAYNGDLRLVTTLDGYSYTTWEDKERGFVNTVWPDEQQKSGNALWVLDGDLQVVGSLTGLAEDERVYSVRFDGEVGYFVTFRQVDPLFAVDLSDRQNPTVLSALKIPGFSEYLHVWDDGRLLGLGYDADEKTGRTGNMKLSMFDTSDKTDVTEKHKLILSGNWSEALYNHKAILVSREKNVVAFPMDGGYAVYGYDDAKGFSLRAELEMPDMERWYGNARGLYADGFAYVVFETGVWVLDLETLEPVTTVSW